MMGAPGQISIHYLPESIQELIEVVGWPATLVIVEARGGVRLCVPSQATADHWLAERIGMQALIALVERYRGEEIEVARCAAAIRAGQERQILREASAGASNATLARQYGYTERGIRKLRRRVEREQANACAQGQLFAFEASGE